ncbi:hypothetical protein GCM10009602_25970 [Nocardiopsis tropica]
MAEMWHHRREGLSPMQGSRRFAEPCRPVSRVVGRSGRRGSGADACARNARVEIDGVPAEPPVHENLERTPL